MAALAGVPHTVLPINTFAALGGNALTDATVVLQPGVDARTQLPNTFVPGRNLIFLTFAAALAYQRAIHHLVTGVTQTDYSGYPDCREATLRALEQAIRLGMDYDITFH
ncbi:7-cyano-7-deazaguanine synthase, partial [Arthrospira platensis SPKY1]|nr:7-cyano-7-deazaguanine synthase [Arthrospira platensis SPKY1]